MKSKAEQIFNLIEDHRTRREPLVLARIEEILERDEVIVREISRREIGRSDDVVAHAVHYDAMKRERHQRIEERAANFRATSDFSVESDKAWRLIPSAETIKAVKK